MTPNAEGHEQQGRTCGANLWGDETGEPSNKKQTPEDTTRS
jgi:hypothetical protein